MPATIALPSARGFGVQTLGAFSAGVDPIVYHVTNLNSTGAGSFHDGAKLSVPRVIVFDVSGEIVNEDPLSVNDPYITVLGQTSPGGVCISGEETRLQSHDMVWQHMRFRTGDRDPPRDGWDNRDAMNYGHPTNLGQTYRIVVDHCSFSWSVDECYTIWYDAHDITTQWCIFAEPLHDSFHPDKVNPSITVPHSMSVLSGIAARRLSYHHNLIANGNQRNPQFAGNLFSYDPTAVIDFEYNVIFNWGEEPCKIQKAGNKVNLIRNYWKAGPNSTRTPTRRVIGVASDAGDALLYVEGNITPLTKDPTADNWPEVVTEGGAAVPETGHRSLTKLPCPDVTDDPNESAMDAYKSVLRLAGATPTRRDAIDDRVVKQTKRRCWKQGTDYIIDTPTVYAGTAPGMNALGWPTFPNNPVPLDSDQDGVPDSYEDANGMDKLDPTDSLEIGASGYPKILEYAWSIAP